MPRNIVLVGIISVSLLTLALFQVKYKVVALEDEIAGLNREIFQVEESIHLLKAEWAYRTSPVRLSQLAAKYLDLKPYRAEQIETTTPVSPGVTGGEPLLFATSFEKEGQNDWR